MDKRFLLIVGGVVGLLWYFSRTAASAAPAPAIRTTPPPQYSRGYAWWQGVAAEYLQMNPNHRAVFDFAMSQESARRMSDSDLIQALSALARFKTPSVALFPGVWDSTIAEIRRVS
jgi:hypothetical protein